MALILDPDFASVLVDAAIAEIPGGTIAVYTGTLPTDLDPTGDTLLAEFDLTSPAAGAGVDGVATFDTDPPIETTVLADGTAGYFLALDAATDVKFGGTVTTNGGGGDLQFAVIAWTTGNPLRLVTSPASTLTVPTEA